MSVEIDFIFDLVENKTGERFVLRAHTSLDPYDWLIEQGFVPYNLVFIEDRPEGLVYNAVVERRTGNEVRSADGA